MIVYHRTDALDAIRREGFRDGTGTYMTVNLHTGVWVSNMPLDINEGAAGRWVLTLEIPDDVVEPYEWVQETNFGYREFLVPAEILNRYPIADVTEDEQ